MVNNITGINGMRSFAFILLILLTEIINATELSEYRTPKEIKKLYHKNINHNKTILEKGIYLYLYQYYNLETVSVREFDELNMVEEALLKIFDNAYIHFELLNYYIISDENGNLGFCDLYGNIIIPITDNFAYVFYGWGINGVVIGNIDHQNLINTVVGRSGSSAGYLNAVYNNDCTPIIPYDKYDIVEITWRGTSAQHYFYVANFQPDGTLTWGVCGRNGEVVVPCEYKRVYCEGNRYYGDNKWSMDYQKSLVEDALIRKMDRQAKTMMALSVIGAIGQTAVNVLSIVQNNTALQNYNSESSESNSDIEYSDSNPSNYKISYQQWEKLAKRNYNTIISLGYDNRATNSGSAEQGMNPGNYVIMKKYLRKAQNEMAKIRRKAARQGISIPQSEWETVTVSY